MTAATRLRVIDFRGLQEEPHASGSGLQPWASGWDKNAWNGVAMYTRYALPVATQGLAKLNVYGSTSGREASTEAVLGIANVWAAADMTAFDLAQVGGQQRFVLTTLHRGVKLAAARFGFTIEPFDAAERRVIAEAFANEYWVGKPIASPDRKLKAQLFYRFDQDMMLYLVFTDKAGVELNRVRFGRCSEANVGRVTWETNRQVRVMRFNRRDYWLCGIDGQVEFCDPRVASADPHALYQYAITLLDGIDAMPNRELGLAMLARAAAAGYPHAAKRLAQENRP